MRNRTANMGSCGRARLTLLVIVLVGGWLRFVGVVDVGIRYEDEAAYVADARMWHRLAGAVVDPEAMAAWRQGDQVAWDRVMSAHGVHFDQRHPKPSQGYTWLGSVAMVLLGDRPEALLLLNALLGTLTILVGYAVAWRMASRGAHGIRTSIDLRSVPHPAPRNGIRQPESPNTYAMAVSLLFAAILATSPYHIAYCRGAWTEPVSALLVLVAVLCWMRSRDGYRSRWRWMLAAGLTMGYASCCHYRAAMIAVGLMAWPACVLVFRQIRRHRWRTRPLVLYARSLVPFVLGAVVPALLIEIIMHGLRGVVGAKGISLPIAGFFEACVYWAGIVARQTSYTLTDPVWQSEPAPLAMARLLAKWHGWLAVAMVGLGLVVACVRNRDARLLAVITIVSLVMWSLQPFILGRLLVMLLPLMFMSMAIGIAWLVSRVRPRPVLRVSVAAAVVVWLALPVWSQTGGLLRQRSQVPDACSFLASQGAMTLVVPRGGIRYLIYLDGTPVEVVELGHDDARADRAPDVVLSRLRSDGVRWFLTDASPWHRPRGDYIHAWWITMEHLLVDSATLLVEFPDIAGSRWSYLAESGCLASLDAMTRAQGGPIRIYDISKRSLAEACDLPR